MGMKFLANELKHRGSLRTPVQTPNDEGGYDITYASILNFWMGLENESAYLRAIRGENTTDGITQVAIARFQTFERLGCSFSTGFSKGCDMISDINPVKGNYFLFMNEGRSTKGRLFKIMSMARDERYRMWVRIMLHEVEEQGTGAAE